MEEERIYMAAGLRCDGLSR